VSFDRKTNTISFRDEPALIVDMGALFVTELRNDASTPGIPKDMVEDWKIVESWLGCTGRELTDDDCQKIGIAWRSYIARGVAPSVALEPVFKEFSKKAKEQGWKTEKVPPDLFRVFDRLLARDKEIQEKRARDALQFASSLRTLSADQQKSASPPEVGSRLKKTLSSLSRRKRATIVLLVAWVTYVIFRTSGNYELVGIRLYRWDSDTFLLNILLPPLIVVGVVWLYKWVTSAK
jgi:hypothetical protein